MEANLDLMRNNWITCPHGIYRKAILEAMKDAGINFDGWHMDSYKSVYKINGNRLIIRCGSELNRSDFISYLDLFEPAIPDFSKELFNLLEV